MATGIAKLLPVGVTGAAPLGAGAGGGLPPPELPPDAPALRRRGRLAPPAAGGRFDGGPWRW